MLGLRGDHGDGSLAVHTPWRRSIRAHSGPQYSTLAPLPISSLRSLRVRLCLVDSVFRSKQKFADFASLNVSSGILEL